MNHLWAAITKLTTVCGILRKRALGDQPPSAHADVDLKDREISRLNEAIIQKELHKECLTRKNEMRLEAKKIREDTYLEISWVKWEIRGWRGPGEGEARVESPKSRKVPKCHSALYSG